MKVILRGILALVIGLFVGGCVNMAIVMLSPHVIPPPPGVDVNDAKSIAAAMPSFEPKHFIFPFLAHAFGTLVGAAVGYLLAVRYRAAIAYAIGVVFLGGGIAAAFMIPAPAWFVAVDLLFAYLPMAFLGVILGRKFSPSEARETAN